MKGEVHLGMRVRFRQVAKKRRHPIRYKGSSCVGTAWVRVERTGEGIVIGVKVVKDGLSYPKRLDGASCWVFVPNSHHRVIVVKENLRSSPVMIFPDQIEEVNDG